MEITDFNPISAIYNADSFLVYTEGLVKAKIPAVIVRAYLTTGLEPSIGKDGYWYVGETNTNVKAEGSTPELRRGEQGIEASTDDSKTWTVVALYSDLSLKYSQLTDKEKEALRQDLSEEIVEATANANTATTAANTAASNANTAAQAATTATSNVKDAITAANTATANTTAAINSANTAAQLATSAAENVSTSINAANTAATNATDAATTANTATTNANAATSKANNVAEHPTKIGEDNYVYVWNYDTQSYTKTNTYVKGDPFNIKHVYTSVAEMNADTKTQYITGDLVLINTNDVENADDAKIYAYNGTNFDFLIDMSGATGFTGKTPQFAIGTVTEGNAAVSLNSNGTDSGGNPKFNLDFSIPKGNTGDSLTYDDLTEEQIASLKKPATDAAADLTTFEASISTAEADRVTAETARINAETQRLANEETRVSNETARVTAEQSRATAETARISSEETRVSNESTRVSAEDVRVSNESTRVASETERINAETGRTTAESNRVTAESSRVTAEQARVTQNTDRDTEYNTLKTDLQSSITKANTAVETANNAATVANNAATVATNAAASIKDDYNGLLDSKFDNAYVQDGKLYLQANGVDKVGPLEVGSGGGGSTGISYNVIIQNNLPSKSFSANKGENAYVNFTFISQEKYTTATEYSDTGERGICKIYARTSNSSSYIQVVDDFYVQSNAVQNIDVINFLTSGTNQIMIKITGEITSQTTPAMVYTVVLTELSINANTFNWASAFAGDIVIPFYIGGNIDKRLNVTVTGTNYTQTYTQGLGTTIYTDSAYNYTISHLTTAGVYTISAYVDNLDGSIKTKTLSWNIMSVNNGTDSKLVIINNKAATVTNWTENVLFDYSITDGTAVNTTATFKVLKGTTVIYQSEESNITTNLSHQFTLSLEQDTADSSDFIILVDILDGETLLTNELSFTVNNSLGYGAAPNSVFYVNPRSRNNSQSNYNKIINEVDGSIVTSTFTNMNWSNDGWTKDSNNNSILRLMAQSTLSIGYKPFKTECSTIGKTIELDFKVDNVTDYDQDIITIATSQNTSFIGLKIKPNEVSMFSQAKKDASTQNLPIDNGVRIRLTLVITPNAYGNQGFNLCSLYINSKKNREFVYETNDYFAHDANIVIGNNYADIDIYGIRIYDKSLSFSQVHQNYINWLETKALKDADKLYNDIMDSNGSEIDFTNTVDQRNVFVFDNTFPKKSDQSSRVGTLEFYLENDITKKITITNVTAAGQGTSSKYYYEWNQKFTIGSSSQITYADNTTTTKKVKLFDGVPACAKITAKKNWASSMQDHKAGSVNAYTDVYKQLGLTNEAITADSTVRVSVYQEPMIGFMKSVNSDNQTIYTYMGEFTVGPDKGDKYCFGYDTTAYPGLISIEGSDNAPLPALFRVPWTTSKLVYSADEEAFQYNGINSWDFDAGNTANISKWIPAYNLVYQCSNRIKPYNGTLDALNADVNNYRNTGYDYWIALNGDTNKYNVYYYESAEGMFVPSDIGNGTINLKTQLVGYNGLTDDIITATTDNDALNTLFINARIAKFKAEATTYFDIDDAVFHSNWVEFTAGTDQRAKNTYPYTFGTDTSLWKWRVDDTDTIFPIDNQGQDKKAYYVETHDTYSNGANIWNGETSNFWNLLELAFPDKLKTGMKNMFDAMSTLSGLQSGTAYDKVYAFYSKYFLGVKEYFPSNSVNLDSKRYEIAKLAYIAGTYSNDTDPITQLHGDFYSAETAWVKKRITYMMSKYNYGTFTTDSADSISFRAAGDSITYNLVPAIALYPTIQNGTSIIRGNRTYAGESCNMVISLSGTGDQQNNILGASFLMSIGDFHTKNISGAMTVKGKMLRELLLGSKTDSDNITIAITSLTLSDCISLQNLLLSNISTLSGVLDLTACTHLRQVYADGTSITQIKLPSGGALSLIEYPQSTQYLTLQNFPVLQSSGVIIDTCKENITDFYVSDCPQLNPVDLLSEIITAQSSQETHTLKRIRAIWDEFTYDTGGATILDNIVKLTDGTYSGLDANGVAIANSYPTLEGTLNINTNCYEDTVTALMNKFTQLNLNITGEYYLRFADATVQSICATNWGDGTGITKAQCAAVSSIGNKLSANTTLTSFEELKYFTKITKLDGNPNTLSGDTSLTSIDLVNITAIGYGQFRDFSKLRFAKNANKLNSISPSAFSGCTSLEEIDLSGMTQLSGDSLFMDCKALKTINISNVVKILGGDRDYHGVFPYCTSLSSVSFPKLTWLGGSTFYGCTSLNNVIIPKSVTRVEISVFHNCTNLNNLIFEEGGSTLFIGSQFIGYTAIKKITLPAHTTSLDNGLMNSANSCNILVINAITPPTLGGSLGGNSTCIIYVPDGSVDSYKIATNWSNYASRIKAISTFTE